MKKNRIQKSRETVPLKILAPPPAPGNLLNNMALYHLYSMGVTVNSGHYRQMKLIVFENPERKKTVAKQLEKICSIQQGKQNCHAKFQLQNVRSFRHNLHEKESC